MADHQQVEKYYKHLFQQCEDGILIADLHSKKFLDANAHICKMLGYELNEILQLSVMDIHPKEDFPKIVRTFEAQARGEIKMAHNIPCIKKNGEVFYVDINTMSYEGEGRVVNIGIFRDMTSYLKNQQIIADNEKQYQALFDLSQDAIMTMNKDNMLFTSCNKATLRLFDCAGEEEFTSNTPLDLSPEFQPCGMPSMTIARDTIGQVMNTGSAFFEWTHQTTKGKEFPATVLLTRLQLDTKDILLATVRDITQQKKTENDLRQAKIKAEAANEAKSVFLANMSHELRTPMNGVLGLAQLLELTNLTEQQQKYLKDLKQCGTTLVGILGDILNIASIESGKLKLQETPFNLCELLESTITVLEREACEKGLVFSKHIDIKEHCRYKGDSLRINQIFTNLIGNAIKFTDEGSVEVKCRIDCHLEKCLCHFTIKDTGIGIAEDQQVNIFESFEQANHGIINQYGGTGLGLSIVKKLVLLMGGKVTLDSELNKGSTFTVSIPLKKTCQNKEKLPEKESQIHDFSSKNLNILVVDDDRVNLIVIEKLARQISSHVSTALNGQEAVDLATENFYDIILMDVRMPILNGLEATQKIRDHEQTKKLKKSLILAVTAHALEEDRINCLEAGMDDFLTKPLSFQALTDMLAVYTK
ncbi:MAG: response regulator [Planctomycetes bacterium]|nr:response regulator [Planctomycetota bacterium]